MKIVTFTNYPEDALNFIVGSDKGVKAFGNYWVHNNTFNKGYNAWDITGERDKYAGDGTIDMAYVHNVTVRIFNFIPSDFTAIAYSYVLRGCKFFFLTRGKGK